MIRRFLVPGRSLRAKTHLSRLLERVAAGERVVISKAGRPVADLVPHQRSPVVIGGMRDEIRYDDADFDDPDPDVQAMFFGDGSRNRASRCSTSPPVTPRRSASSPNCFATTRSTD